MQNPVQAKEKSPLGGEGGSCGEGDCPVRTGEDCTPGENESVDGLAANGKPLLRYLNNVFLSIEQQTLRDAEIYLLFNGNF